MDGRPVVGLALLLGMFDHGSGLGGTGVELCEHTLLLLFLFELWF